MNEKNKYFYVIFAAEPYENIAIKIPNMELNMENKDKNFYWDEDNKIFYLTIYYK